MKISHEPEDANKQDRGKDADAAVKVDHALKPLHKPVLKERFPATQQTERKHHRD